MALRIDSLANLDLIASWLHSIILTCQKPPILLYGPLGSGKTTLVSALVKLMPGAKSCEVGSPSFNVCNYYPVDPQILHCDLYRNKFSLPLELEEALDNAADQIIIEWAEYMRKDILPENYLDIIIIPKYNYRLLDYKIHGLDLQKSFNTIPVPELRTEGY